MALFAGGHAKAAGLPAPLAGSASAKLTQDSAGTWTATVYLNTAALCLGPNTFDLVTTTPNSDTRDAAPLYAGGLQCAMQAAHPVTEVILTFTSSPALTAVPQTATLTVTPPALALLQGAAPLEVPLTVRRTVSAFQYVWIPAGCGAALAVLLVGCTMLAGVPRAGGKRAHMHRMRFWRMPLYAASAWTFGDSWATNVTAVSALIGTVLTASGTVAGLLPGVELGRFSLLIALAGGITVIAPILFAVLNTRFSRADPAAAAGVSAVCLRREADDRYVEIGIPGSGTLTLHGRTVAAGPGLPLSPGTVLDVPAGAVVSVSAADSGPAGTWRRVLVLPGGTDLAVPPGQRLSIDKPVTVPAGAAADGAVARPSRFWSRAVPAAAAAAVALPPGTHFDVPEGATISFLGRAGLMLPAGACVEAPVGDPAHPPRRSVLKYHREFAIPRSSEVVATQMWTMLAASCLTVFGIGAEIGIIGWVLGYDLAVAPQWARVCGAVLAGLTALLFLGYGVRAILALAESRDGSALSNARGSSFML